MRLTKPAFAHQGVSILQSRRPPFRVIKVVCQQPQRRSLFAVPTGHAPQPLQHRFLLEGEIEERAVDGIFHFTLGILVASNDLELSFLET